VGLAMENINGKDAIRKKINLPPGEYACLSVGDNGCGMSSATRKRIFEPYFTTKSTGEGTGLGLATVHGIVQSHHGAVSVKSKRGEGTTFHIYLPFCEQAAEMARPEIGVSDIEGSERVLYVDDEEQLALLVKMGLERLGYNVQSRVSSVEALEAFRANPKRFDIVITDQTMPHMTGTELAKRLIEIRPDLPIVLCTGFGFSLGKNFKDIGICEVINKPVLTKELAAAIRRSMLARRGG